MAIERAQRMRRAVKWTVSVNIIGYLVLLTALLYAVDLPANAFFWTLAIGYAVVVALSPIAGWIRLRQLDRAVRVNSPSGTAR